MRLTSQFAALLSVLLLLTGGTGGYLVASLANASEEQAVTLTRAAEITASTERLGSIANQEVALILGYLRGAATLDEVSATRAAFEREVAHLADLADGDPSITSELARVRAVEDSLFRVPEEHGGGDLSTLLIVSREAKALLLEKNQDHRVRALGYTEAFADAQSEERMRELVADIERERVAILEFEPALLLGEDHASERLNTTYRLNSEIVDALAHQAAADLRIVVNATDDLEEVYPERAPQLRRIQGNLTLLAHRVESVGAITDRDWTERLFNRVEENVTLAEALGLPVKRGTVPHVGENVTSVTTLGTVLVHQQRMRHTADTYFNATLTLSHAVRGSFDSRAEALAASVGRVTDAAESRSVAAQAEADDALDRAGYAVLAGLVLLVASVTGGAALVVRGLRNRLAEFDAAAASLSDGRFDAPPPRALNDDFDGLAEAWTRMTAALADRDQKIAETSAILHQNERMAAIGSLVAGVAHEINNPLFFVRGNEEMALADLDDLLAREDVRALPGVVDTLQAVRDGMDVNLEGLTRIENTNRALKGFASPTRTHRELVDVNEVADGVLIIAHNRLKNRFRIERDFGELPRVRASSQEIGQVVLNLVMNAAEASPDGSAITIRTEARDGEVHVTVKDDGPGVPEDMRDSLFKQFATTKPDGTGLGLFISERIAGEHGGRLWLSGNDSGAAFTLALPVATKGAGDHTQRKTPRPRTAAAKENDQVLP